MKVGERMTYSQTMEPVGDIVMSFHDQDNPNWKIHIDRHGDGLRMSLVGLHEDELAHIGGLLQALGRQISAEDDVIEGEVIEEIFH